jgi:hypothetical protein
VRRATCVAISTVCLQVVAIGQARAGWLAPYGFESPSDSVDAEFSRINLLPPGSAQVAYGLPFFQHDSGPRSNEFEGTFGLRFKLPDWINYVPSLRGAMVAGFGERSFATMDLQFGGNAFRPRGIELLTTRDWDFKIQLRGGFATFDAAAPPAGAPPGPGTTTRDFASFGLPLAMSAGQNFTLRALQDLVRVWWGGPEARQWQINLNAGILLSTGDVLSFTVDGGITSILTGWRAPATAAVWFALSRHAALSVGGGFPDISARFDDWSIGASLLESVP